MLSVKMIIITIIDKRIIIIYNTDIQETKCQKNCQKYNTDIQETKCQKNCQKLGNKNKSTLKMENDYDKI